MTKIKKITAAALLLSAVLTLSGCFPSGEKDPDVSVDTVHTENGIFEYEKENLNAKFGIPAAPENLTTRIKVKEKNFNKDEAFELLFSNKTVIEEESSREEGIWWATDGANLCIQENYLQFSNGTTFRNGLGLPENAPINYYINIRYSEEQYRDMLNIGEELEGFSSQSAIDRALELCSRLGISGLGKPEVYAFDLETYDKIKEISTSSWINKELPLTKDNEVYFLRFKRSFGGVDFADVYDVAIDDSTSKTGKGEIGSSETIIGVSKDDIYYFEVKEAYEPEYETVSTEPIKYGFDYALNELSSYLEKSYFKEETTFRGAELVYFPAERKDGGYVEYTLAWCFEGAVKKRENNEILENYDIVFLTENGYRKDYNY